MSKPIFKEKKYSILLIILLLALVIYFLASIIGLRSQIHDVDAENESISQQISEKQEENKELESVIDNEDKDGYIERIAREDYGYAGEDERVYYAPDAK